MAGLVGLVFVFMFGIFTYSAGYRVREGDGRVSLVTDMFIDYGRDGGEWSFGYFVLPAIALLVWIRRKDVFTTEVRPAVISGAVFIVFALLLFWAGYRGSLKYLGYASGQILALGAILWFLGWSYFRRLFWLWVLLGMMWPWRFLIGRISSPLQLIMVEFSARFMNLIGVRAVPSGSSLSTDTLDPKTGIPISLDVDVACSGMRSLFALVLIGLIFAFLRVDKEWKRWVVMAFVPVVAILGNFVRLMTLYFGSVLNGTKFAIGENHEMSGFHLFAGLLVFVVALILMSGLVAALMGNGVKFRKTRKVVTSRVNSPS